MNEILLGSILIVMIIGALVALETEKVFPAVLIWGGVNLSLSLIFVLLKAFDLAFIQLVVELIILVLVLRATGSVNDTVPREKSLFSAVPRYAAAALLASGFVYLVYLSMAELPPFGLPLFKAAQTVMSTGTQLTGFTNLTGAVFLKIRALDGFAVLALFLVAVVGSLSLLKGKEQK